MKPIKKEDKNKGIVGAIVVHLAVLVWLIIMAMAPLPDPPFPEEKVVMTMDFRGGGGSEGGSTSTEVTEEPSKESEETESSNSSEEVVTQEQESPVESSSAPASSNSDNSSAEKEEKQQPKYSGLGGAFGKGKGDKEGDGKGGSGGGTGGGHGPKTGDGNGVGDGKGRILTYKPKFVNPTQETGKVVVAITINRAGKVIKAVAKPGNKGTTTANILLHRSAEKQAKTLKFNANPNGPKYDKMATTIVFTLN